MQSIDIYSALADSFAQQYELVSFESVHKDWLHLIPAVGIALDVGAGSGRDAAYLVKQGLKVVAVEPAKKLRHLAQKLHQGQDIQWMDDRLPDLKSVRELSFNFDIILLSAVWMHLRQDERDIALKSLNELLDSNGLIVITLRHGSSPDERVMYPVSRIEIFEIIERLNLPLCELTFETSTSDALGRDNVKWETVVLKRNCMDC
ncbi:class I SAM-dependent methyltransferase [Alteromonas facilis]|uniref:class I SAM-dependent methyltransferase n=1 Tax=Alteromonas facilis TaxID=2048004 RepID=UPI000C284A7E|nr:class I SAM-dependent methyltransferase [Alteromonas facilis]